MKNFIQELYVWIVAALIDNLLLYIIIILDYLFNNYFISLLMCTYNDFNLCRITHVHGHTRNLTHPGITAHRILKCHMLYSLQHGVTLINILIIQGIADGSPSLWIQYMKNNNYCIVGLSFFYWVGVV